MKPVSVTDGMVSLPRRRNVKVAAWWASLPREEVRKRVAKMNSKRTKESFVKSGIGRWRNVTEEKRRDNSIMMNQKRKEMPDMKAGPNMMAAKIWRLRDPNNRVWEFRNLQHFVREHPELFNESDLVWKMGSSKSGLGGAWCRATGGLKTIRPSRKKSSGTWKGWRWVSITERRFNDGGDLMLGQEPPTIVANSGVKEHQ